MAENGKALAFNQTTVTNSLDLVSKIISLSTSVKVFLTKWKLIRSKLEELNDVLVAVELEQTCGELSDVVEAVKAVDDVLDECLKLARMCVELSYKGKLLMQSDLDVLLGKLEFHVKVLFRVLSFRGLMMSQHQQALVVLRPGLGACRDDLRFYVRDLVCRIKIGDVEMKKEAFVLMNEALVLDERFVNVLVEDEDFIDVFVRILDSPEALVQEQCVKILCIVSGFEDYRGVLVGGGVIRPLIKVLETGSEVGKETGVRCLMRLTANSDNAWSVSAQGGVTALLKICSDRDCCGELVGLSCGVLKNLAEVEEIKQFMVDEGAISVLVELVVCEDETAQLGSVNLLQALAYKDESVRQIIIKEGGILALARVLNLRSTTYSQKSKELALRAMDNLCFSSIVTLNSLISNGFLDQLVYILQNGDVLIQEMALKSVYRLCGVSEEARKAMGDAGIMPELIPFLNAKSFEIQSMASESLQNMVSVQKNLKHLSQDDRSINLLLQQLESIKGNALNRKVLLCTLLAISSNSAGRKKIARSPYIKNIERLAETDADWADGKKLLRKLSSGNSFRKLISGIWKA